MNATGKNEKERKEINETKRWEEEEPKKKNFQSEWQAANNK